MSTVHNLSGVAHATAAVRLLVPHAHGTLPLPALLDELTAVEALSALMLAAVKRHTTTDGRCDTRDIAADMIESMIPMKTGRLEELVDNATAVTALARLLTEAFDSAIAGGQGINFNDAAVHVLRNMRGSQR